MHRLMQALTGPLPGTALRWLLALALGLAGWGLLQASAEGQPDRVARAASLASAELGPALHSGAPPPLPQVRALLAHQGIGFAWLRLRDTQGHAIAAAGKLGSARTGLLSSERLRRQAYALVSTEHSAPLLHQGMEVGRLEFGLLIANPGSGDLWGRQGLGLLVLLLGILFLLFLTPRLIRLMWADWSGAAPAAIPAVTLHRHRMQPVTDTIPTMSPDAAGLMAVFGRGGIVVDREGCVRDINAQATALTGWPREQAFGQPLSKVLPLSHKDSDVAVALPLDDCLQGRRQRLQGHYRLQGRDGLRQEVELVAGPIRDPAGRIGGVLLSLRKPEPAGEALKRFMPAMAQPDPSHASDLSAFLVDQALECVVSTDSQDRIQFANGHALQKFGYELIELRGEHISRLLPAPFLQKSQLRIADLLVALPGGAPPTAMARRRDGSQFHAVLEVHPVSLRGRDGHVVTIRFAAQAVMSGDAVLAPELRQLLESSQQEVYVVDPDSLQLRAANSHAQANLGYSHEQLAMLTLPQLCGGLTPAMLRRYVTRLRTGVDDRLESRQQHRRANGTSYEVQASLSLWQGGDSPLLLWVAQDVAATISSPQAALRELRLDFMEHHDVLTGLPGPSLFMDRLQQAIDESSLGSGSFIVAKLALPGLVETGQAHGQDSSQVLKAVADRLGTMLGRADTVARDPQGEFLMLLRDGRHNPANARAAAQVLQQALSRPLRLPGGQVSLKACLGAAIFPVHAASAEALLFHADQALRKALAQGVDRVSLYDPAMPSASVPGIVLSPRQALAVALARGELGIELQVITNVRTRLVVAAEVLLAWRYPGRGLLRTATQVAEASGDAALASALGAWMLEQACEQQSRWRDLELKVLPLVVNLSALPLAHRRDAQELRGVLAQYRVPAQQLIVMVHAEELESLQDATASGLPVLRDLGLRLGVSDVDPSQLALLRRVDADLLQLTPSSIAGLPGSREAAERTAAIVEVAQRIGARLCAGGVERVGQREALLALGCFFQQGRLLAEPQAPREFARSLLRAEMGVF